MSYQRGSIRIEDRAAGPSWIYRWYRNLPSGKRAETTKTVGTVAAIGKSKAAAWREVDRLRLTEMANTPRHNTAPTFGELASSYLSSELTRMAHSTQYTLRHNVEAYLLRRWEKHTATEMKPLEIEDWFAYLREQGLAAPTISKLRATLMQIFRHAQRVGLISRAQEANPINFVRAATKSDYKAIIVTPEQAALIIARLGPLERVLAYLSATTGLRSSELLGLKWQDVDFAGQRIFVRRTWVQGKIGRPKTDASAAPVPMSGELARVMQDWRNESPYAADADFVFPSFKKKGKQPREGSVLAADHIRRAAVEAGVLSAEYKGRFGLHNFRSSLCTALVAQGVDVKTVQGVLRHRQSSTTLDVYAQTVPAQAMRAQEQFITAMNGSAQ